MVKIARVISEKPYNREDGKALCLVELRCDNGSELDGLTEIDNKVFMFGSIAWAVREGKVYAMDSEGTWYDQNAESEVTG